MKDIDYACCYKKTTFKGLLADFVGGVFRYRYPLCCVLQFVWERYNGLLSWKTRKEKFSLDRFYMRHFGYVPCNRCLKKYLKEIK